MRVLPLLAMGIVAAACAERPNPPLDALRQPTGMALDPSGRWLFVTGGNWDEADAAGALWSLDLDGLAEAIDGAGNPGVSLSSSRPCRRVEDSDAVECDDGVLIDEDATVFLGTGAGNIDWHLPKGPDGPVRLLIPVRSPASVTWVEVTVDGGGASAECGQGDGRRCGATNEVTTLTSDPNREMPRDPANLLVDTEFGYAYVPHLLDGRLSLLKLFGAAGPELTDIESDFYRTSPFEGLDVAGGFAVVKRSCDPANPLAGSQECGRPFMYTTHRYWPGIRQFTIAAGLDVVQGRSEASLLGFDAEQVELRPFMGDLEFVDASTSDTLLVVNTTPPGLLKVDTSVDEDGVPRDDKIATTPLCRNPNMLEIVRPTASNPLAFVTCYSDDLVAVVSTGAFDVIATIAVGAGPNELIADPVRGWVYVANTREDTISVIGTDPQSPGYLAELARIGLGGSFEAPS